MKITTTYYEIYGLQTVELVELRVLQKSDIRVQDGRSSRVSPGISYIHLLKSCTGKVKKKGSLVPS